MKSSCSIGCQSSVPPGCSASIWIDLVEYSLYPQLELVLRGWVILRVASNDETQLLHYPLDIVCQETSVVIIMKHTKNSNLLSCFLLSLTLLDLRYSNTMRLDNCSSNYFKLYDLTEYLIFVYIVSIQHSYLHLLATFLNNIYILWSKTMPRLT